VRTVEREGLSNSSFRRWRGLLAAEAPRLKDEMAPARRHRLTTPDLCGIRQPATVVPTRKGELFYKPTIVVFSSEIPDERRRCMSRLTIDVTEQQHQTLKAMAALEGKSIKQYTLERLFPSDEDQALQELKALLRDRMAEAERGELDERSIAEIAEGAIRQGGAA
jgi:uncharacterized protein (DUF1778 family)